MTTGSFLGWLIAVGVACVGCTQGASTEESVADQDDEFQAAGVDGWWEFGRTPRHNGYNPNETTIGTGNVASLHELWHVDLPLSSAYYYRRISASFGKLFVTGNTIVKVDAGSGQVEHIFSAISTDTYRGYATITDRHVFVDSDSGFYRTDEATLTERVTFGPNDPQGTRRGQLSPYRLVLFSSTIEWPDDFGESTPEERFLRHSTLSAHAQSYGYDGGVLWKNDYPHPWLTTPALSNGRAIVGFGDHVEARNWFSGSPLWTAPIGDPINNDLEPRTVGDPIVSHGRVFVCRAGVLYALDERSGAQLWTAPCGDSARAADAERVVFSFSRCEIKTFCEWGDEGEVCAPRNVCTPGIGIVAYDASTGEELYKEPFASTTSQRMSTEELVIANGVVYYGTRSGLLVARDASTGALLAEFAVGSQTDVVVHVIVVSGRVFVATQSKLIALGF
ncbi:MAG: PQQ-binding-like beta-propeller repeat protein [Myxococcota bacterium]